MQEQQEPLSKDPEHPGDADVSMADDMERSASVADDNDAESAEDFDTLLPIDEHEELVSEGGKTIRRRGIFLLPNLLTLGALFAGFYAIIAGMAGDFNEAGWAIFIAGVLDGLDGRIALAPALIMFSWAFEDIGRLGWAASFIYMSCAALRLARFNVQLGTTDKRFFVGLQSPLAAGVVTFLPWVGYRYGLDVTPSVGVALAVVTVFIGLLMVSNYRYISFKEIDFKGTVPYFFFVAAVVLLVVIAQNPHETLLLMSVTYSVTGPLMWVYRKQQSMRTKSAS